MNLLKKATLISLMGGILILGCDKKGDNPTGPTINHNPVIEQIITNPPQIYSGDNTYLECIAKDEDEDPLSYNWSCNGGFLNQNVSKEVIWTSPSGLTEDLEYILTVGVNDNQGGSASDNVSILVMTKYDTIFVSDDGYVSSFDPTWNPQTNYFHLLSIYKNLAGNTEAYLVYGNLNPEKEIKSAKLRFSIREDDGVGIGEPDSNEPLLCGIHEITDSNPWISEELTWDTKPGYNVNPFMLFTIPTVQQYPCTFYVEDEDLTDLVKSWKNNPSSNDGLAWVPYGICSGYSRLFYSKEGAQEEGNLNYTPALIIEYE